MVKILLKYNNSMQNFTILPSFFETESLLFQRNLFGKKLRSFSVFSLNTLFIMLSSIIGSAQAPPIQWKKNIGGSKLDQAQSIVQTNDGGYIMAGSTQSEDGEGAGNNVNKGLEDCWIVKMDAVGTIQWSKLIGGSIFDFALSIIQTKDGGYLVSGYTYSDDGDLPENPNSFSSDAVIIKLDASGNMEWLKTFGGSGFDIIFSIKETHDGGYIGCGWTDSKDGDVAGNHGDRDGWIIKTDQAGNLQWQKCIGSKGVDLAFSIVLSPDGGYVFAGDSKTTPGSVVNDPVKFDFFVGKLDSAGNVVWIKNIGGSAEDGARSIVAASDGGYVLAGYSESNDGDFSEHYGGYDVCIIKIDFQGNLQWQRSFGGINYDVANEIAPTSDGGYVVAGNTTLVNGFNGNDYWILKLDVNGKLQWEKTLGGSLSDQANSINETSDGGFIVAGTSFSPNGDISNYLGNGDAWIVKLGVCKQNIPELSSEISGKPNPCTETIIEYSIEPAKDATGYTWKIPIGWKIVSGQGTNAIKVLLGINEGMVTVIAYNSCKSSLEKTLLVTPIKALTPTLKIQADVGSKVCQNAPVIFTADVTDALTPAYQWMKNGIKVGTNSNNYLDNALKDGDVISCEITSQSNCGAPFVVLSNSINMSVSPSVTPAISIQSNTVSICKGEEVRFTSVSTGEGTDPVYQWKVNNVIAGSNAPDFSSKTFSHDDVVTCVLISNNVCAVNPEAVSNPIAIMVDIRIEALVTISTPRTTICKDEEITFQADTLNTGTLPRFSWAVNGFPVGSNLPFFTTRSLFNNDEVVCMVTPGLNTCASSPALSNIAKIVINPLPQLQINPADTFILNGTQIQLNAVVSEDIQSFTWSPQGMLVSQVFSPTTLPIKAPTNFRLSIITRDGCFLHTEALVKPFMPLLMPNAFTPNGDGLNDWYRIPPGTGISLKEFAIYNKWGARVFFTSDASVGWDGHINGFAQPSGVYIYKISGIQNNKPISANGTFTLIH